MQPNPPACMSHIHARGVWLRVGIYEGGQICSYSYAQAHRHTGDMYLSCPSLRQRETVARLGKQPATCIYVCVTLV